MYHQIFKIFLVKILFDIFNDVEYNEILFVISNESFEVSLNI